MASSLNFATAPVTNLVERSHSSLLSEFTPKKDIWIPSQLLLHGKEGTCTLKRCPITVSSVQNSHLHHQIQPFGSKNAGYCSRFTKYHRYSLMSVSTPAIKIDRSSLSVPDIGYSSDEEDDDCLCPVGCVKQIFKRDELDRAIALTKENNKLLVVDFYKTACGSCKYIERGFMKLCKGEAEANNPVVFLKHNVMDEYEEQSEIAEDFKIKVVPLFFFYYGGVLVESFPTREKSKILEAINRYVSGGLEGFK